MEKKSVVKWHSGGAPVASEAPGGHFEPIGRRPLVSRPITPAKGPIWQAQSRYKVTSMLDLVIDSLD